ncbi:unnamed protein product [Caenorhabditis brenneri]
MITYYITIKGDAHLIMLTQTVMNGHFSLLCLYFLVYCTENKQLEDVRQSCKTNKVMIPSGRIASSESIDLHYKDKILSSIINEECGILADSERLRAKRGIKAPFKKIMKPIIKFFKPVGKGLKAGAKYIPVDFGLELLEFAMDQNWNAQEAVNSNNDINNKNAYDLRKEQKIENQIEEFRRDLKNLLYNGTITGYIKNTPSIKKVTKNILSSELKASYVKCIRDDFTTAYSLRLRVEIEETIPVLARKCGDIGETITNENGQTSYKYYEFPNSFLVERNGITYSVNSTACRHDTSSFCPEYSLREESCSVMSTQTCEKFEIILNSESNIIRSLPIGYAFYGPFKEIKLSRKHYQTLKFLLNPFNLEYIRLPEGVEMQLGDSIFYS